MENEAVKLEIFTDEICKTKTIYQQNKVIIKWLSKIISMIEDGTISQISITQNEQGDIIIITKDNQGGN